MTSLTDPSAHTKQNHIYFDDKINLKTAMIHEMTEILSDRINLNLNLKSKIELLDKI